MACTDLGAWLLTCAARSSRDFGWIPSSRPTRSGRLGTPVGQLPSSTNTDENLAEKYAYALRRDALTNVFREFWPDIATHVLHRHP